jgi:integrase
VPARRGQVYYVKRNFRGVGKITKSLQTQNRSRATALESALISLHAQGRLELLRAFADGTLTIEGIGEAYESGRVSELSSQLRESDENLAAAIDAALRNKAPDVRHSTLERYSTGLEHFHSFVGGGATARSALTTEVIQDFKAYRLAEGVARETLNNDLGAISILVSFSLARGWLTERPTIRRFRSAVRIRYLEPDQLAIYMAALRRPFRPLFQLLIGSGMRLGEAESLRVSDLRFGSDGTRALVTDAKTPSGDRAVFLPAWVVSSLRDWLDEKSLAGGDRLFAFARRTVQAEHGRARRIVGIHEYTIHDHRHTAAVHMARAGMPLNLIQQQLGYASISQTMRYARFHPDYSDYGEYFERIERELGLSSGHESGYSPDPVENPEGATEA